MVKLSYLEFQTDLTRLTSLDLTSLDSLTHSLDSFVNNKDDELLQLEDDDETTNILHNQQHRQQDHQQTRNNGNDVPVPVPPVVAADAAAYADAAELAVERIEEHDRVGRLFPNSFQTADLKHVVDNALSEVLECMTNLWLDLTT